MKNRDDIKAWLEWLGIKPAHVAIIMADSYKIEIAINIQPQQKLLFRDRYKDAMSSFFHIKV